MADQLRRLFIIAYAREFDYMLNQYRQNMETWEAHIHLECFIMWAMDSDRVAERYYQLTDAEGHGEFATMIWLCDPMQTIVTHWYDDLILCLHEIYME